MSNLRVQYNIPTFLDVFSWALVKFYESRLRVGLGNVRLYLDRVVESKFWSMYGTIFYKYIKFRRSYNFNEYL